MNHGQDRRYHHPMIGLNGRCDTLQAAVLLAKMEIFEEEVALRSEIGAKYSSKFSEASNGKIVTPFIEADNTSVYAQYTIQIDGRDSLQQALQAKGVPTAVHYPVPLNLQPAFANLNKPAGSFPVSEAVADRVMSLPMHPYLTDTDMDLIVAAVCNSLENN
jgi:UDP-2-acetamido-2-deoxy-ribo-hexuluronate aminotransferase